MGGGSIKQFTTTLLVILFYQREGIHIGVQKRKKNSSLVTKAPRWALYFNMNNRCGKGAEWPLFYSVVWIC